MSGVIAAGVLVGGGLIASSLISAKSAKDAAETQAGSAEAGITETRDQFDKMQELLSPYVEAGTEALGQQQALAGLSGPEEQRAAIQSLSDSPEMAALMQQGENAILQNASATGGLRGGNTQAALAQFRPQMLSSLINQQYGRLGGITQMGQASAAGVGAAGMQTGANIADLLAAQGAATAGGQVAQGQALGQAAMAPANAFLLAYGLKNPGAF